MQAFNEFEAKLKLAETMGLEDQLAASWEAFQLIAMVADWYSGGTPEWDPAWMFTIPLACDGRDFLGQAPSMRWDPAPQVVLPELSGISDGEAAVGLAVIAKTLHESLQRVTATVLGPADAQACAGAVEAASELLEQLAVDEP